MTRKGCLAAGAALFLALGLAGCDSMNNLLDDQPAESSVQAAAMPPQPQDINFAQTAAKDGSKEVRLGELALQKASSPEVKSFAQQMVDDHSAANAELTELADLRDVPLETASTEGPAMAELAALNGKAFDEAYIALMVAEHEKAVALFEKQAQAGSDPTFVEFAEEKLPTLRQHLEHAETLQDSL